MYANPCPLQYVLNSCALNTKDCVYCDTVILEQFLRSERLLIQRLTAGIICRVFRQPLQYEWEIMTNHQFLSLLMSLFDTASIDVQLEALNVCNDLTYHVENTASLCEHQDFLPKLAQVVSRSDPLTRYVGLQVLRNIASAAQVYPSILRAIRSVAKELEKSLLQHFQSYQEVRSPPTLPHHQSTPSFVDDIPIFTLHLIWCLFIVLLR